MSEKARRILFVCTGNTCRSPMARFLLELKAKQAGIEATADSAGVSAVPGAPMSPEAAKALERRGIKNAKNEAKRLNPNLIGQATEIYAMTVAHEDHILELFPFAAKKLQTLRRAAGLMQTDVPDPIGQDERAYELCARSIEEALDIILRRNANAPSR